MIFISSVNYGVVFIALVPFNCREPSNMNKSRIGFASTENTKYGEWHASWTTTRKKKKNVQEKIDWNL
ncbi:hypothetical protein A9F13_07g03234 [Clavispora lusitaniae]|uniref:Uncharacterized protein n=1 Tax=Clavispora lusitaniae TaxID=36911 RepID=A0AA91T2B3_CLALS|nr:hypothetical protein A9F13_07g03234 [Clavispora lusitaniae]